MQKIFKKTRPKKPLKAAKYNTRTGQLIFKKLCSICTGELAAALFMEMERRTKDQYLHKKCVRNIVSSSSENPKLFLIPPITIVEYALHAPYKLGTERRQAERSNAVDRYAVVEAIDTAPGIFSCGSRDCHSQRTRYTQAQTRSGDEGMVCRVSCLDCGYCFKV
jgi:DNA-directed RNA polymerase subunit M/transcription elongation factor TFIIS